MADLPNPHANNVLNLPVSVCYGRGGVMKNRSQRELGIPIFARRPRSIVVIALILVATTSSPPSRAAQSKSSSHQGTTTSPSNSGTSNSGASTAGALSKACLSPEHPSEQITMLLETVKAHPTAGAYNTLGALYAAAGQVKCAIPAFQASLRLDAKNWEAHYNLALAFLTTGDSARASTELHAAIREKPDSATAHFALGTLLYNQKKLAPAATEFDAVLKIDPNFPGAATNLAQVLMLQGNSRAAIALLEKALSQPPPPEQVVGISVALGLAYSQAGQPGKAVDTLQQLIAAHPESADAHLGLGILYASAQPPTLDEAIAQFREALRLDPKKDEARLALGRALIAQQKFSDAVVPLKEYVQRNPLDDQGYLAAALAFKGLEQRGPEVELLDRAARLNPASYEVHYELGLALAEAGETDRAIKELRAAEKIRPSAPEAHDQLARLLAKSGQKELAQKEHTESAALSSRGDSHAEAAKFNARGNQLLAAGDARGAAAAYRQALRADPKNPQLHYNLSLALDKLSDLTAERQELETSGSAQFRSRGRPQSIGHSRNATRPHGGSGGRIQESNRKRSAICGRSE